MFNLLHILYSEFSFINVVMKPYGGYAVKELPDVSSECQSSTLRPRCIMKHSHSTKEPKMVIKIRERHTFLFKRFQQYLVLVI